MEEIAVYFVCMPSLGKLNSVYISPSTVKELLNWAFHIAASESTVTNVTVLGECPDN